MKYDTQNVTQFIVGIALCLHCGTAAAYEVERVDFGFFSSSPQVLLPFTGLPTATSDCVSVQVMIWGEFAPNGNYCTGSFGSIPINSNTVFDLDGIGGINTDSNIPSDGRLLYSDGMTRCIDGVWFTYIFQITKDDFNSQLNNGNLDFVFFIPGQSGSVGRICDECTNWSCCAGSDDRRIGNCSTELSRVQVRLIYNPAAYSTCPECNTAGDCGSAPTCRFYTCEGGECVLAGC